MPPQLIAILNLVTLALQYAPKAELAYEQARDLFKLWFAGGLITYEQQKNLMEWADAHQEATLAGNVPPELRIDPDPTPDSPQAPV